MKGWFARRPVAAGIADTLDDALPGRGGALSVATRACCCPARPVVTVVLPPAPGRPHPVDLLLCGHHYHVSQTALSAAGASVYDQSGMLITASADGPQSAAGVEAVGRARSWQRR